MFCFLPWKTYQHDWKNIGWHVKHQPKQIKPRSNCFGWSSLILLHTVCSRGFQCTGMLVLQQIFYLLKLTCFKILFFARWVNAQKKKKKKLPSVDFFKINVFIIPSECQTVRIQIRPDFLSGLIWVQGVLQRLFADDTGRLRVKSLTL